MSCLQFEVTTKDLPVGCYLLGAVLRVTIGENKHSQQSKIRTLHMRHLCQSLVSDRLAPARLLAFIMNLRNGNAISVVNS